MTSPRFDHAFWQELWSKTLRDHADKVASRPPNIHLTTEVAALTPARALDAGCGHGAESLWLALRGWHVTAIDFSEAAIAHGRAMAEALGSDVAGRVTWLTGDVAHWSVPSEQYTLVTCLYVHIAGRVEDFVRRLANGVAPGGTLFLVGHRPIDPVSGTPTAAANQVQVSVREVIDALDPHVWTFDVAEERPRAVSGSGVDAVVRARRVR